MYSAKILYVVLKCIRLRYCMRYWNVFGQDIVCGIEMYSAKILYAVLKCIRLRYCMRYWNVFSQDIVYSVEIMFSDIVFIWKESSHTCKITYWNFMLYGVNESVLTKVDLRKVCISTGFYVMYQTNVFVHPSGCWYLPAESIHVYILLCLKPRTRVRDAGNV